MTSERTNGKFNIATSYDRLFNIEDTASDDLPVLDVSR